MADRPSSNGVQAASPLSSQDYDLTADMIAVECGDGIAFDQKERAVLLFVVEGRALLKAPGQPALTLESGDLVALKEGGRFELAAVDISGGRVFQCTARREHALVMRLPKRMIAIRSRDEPDQKILRLLVEAIGLELEMEKPNQTVIRWVCEVVVIVFARMQGDLMYLNWLPEVLGRDRQILRAMSAFFAQPQVELTIDWLASEAGLSRSAFFDRFREIFGAPPLGTLTRLRLEQAKSLLNSSGASLSSVATAVGYKSETAFIRAFKRVFGTTPGRWRSDGDGAEAAATDALAENPGQSDD